MSENEFGIPDEVPEVTLTPADDGIKRDEEGRPYRLIRIEMEDGKEDYFPVGHNGKVYQIQRGIPVEVPQCVVDVLKDMVGAKLIDVPNPYGGPPDKQLQDYHTVPFSLLR